MPDPDHEDLLRRLHDGDETAIVDTALYCAANQWTDMPADLIRERGPSTLALCLIPVGSRFSYRPDGPCYVEVGRRKYEGGPGLCGIVAASLMAMVEDSKRFWHRLQRPEPRNRLYYLDYLDLHSKPGDCLRAEVTGLPDVLYLRSLTPA